MSGVNLVKFHLGALDRIREDAAFACKTNLPSRLGPELDSRVFLRSVARSGPLQVDGRECRQHLLSYAARLTQIDWRFSSHSVPLPEVMLTAYYFPTYTHA